MGRLRETIRDPKWVAIGFTALVLIGSVVKLLAGGDEEAVSAAASTTASVAGDPDIAPGCYEISGSSWTSGDSAAEQPEAAGTGDAYEFRALLSEEEKAFQRKAHKNWHGICIAGEGR